MVTVNSDKHQMDGHLQSCKQTELWDRVPEVFKYENMGTIALLSRTESDKCKAGLGDKREQTLERKHMTGRSAVADSNPTLVRQGKGVQLGETVEGMAIAENKQRACYHN